MSDRMIDIFAGTLIVLAVVKLLALAVNAPAWLSAMKMLYARPALTAAISYLLAGLVLAALLASGVTIVQVLAVCLFVVLLLVPAFAPYMDLVLRGLEGKSLGQMLREQRLYTVVWMILLGWGFYALLNR